MFLGLNCKAELIIDDSIHSDIAAKYELEKLPDLPSDLKNQTVDDIFTPNEFDTKPDSKYIPPKSDIEQSTPPKQQIIIQEQQNSQTNLNYKENDARKINKGMKFKVINTSVLSDSMKKGTIINFVSTQTETSRYITFPKGTVFKGIIEDSHSPNLAGNGGLLVIKVNKIIYNQKAFDINAKITIANQKHIFFNNIKGKHKYWKNAQKSTKKGKRFFNTMLAKAKKYFRPGIEIIISPIALVTGTVVYVVNIAVSPVLAIFSKGERLIIPQYSNFEIKMLEDTVIYK